MLQEGKIVYKVKAKERNECLNKQLVIITYLQKRKKLRKTVNNDFKMFDHCQQREKG